MPSELGKMYLQHIGSIASEWTNLEYTTDSCIWILLQVPPEVGGCVTANLQGLNNKVRSLMSLAELRGAPEAIVARFRKFHGRALGTADKRNRAIHDPWHVTGSGETATIEQMVILANQKGRRFASKAIPQTELASLLDEIFTRQDELFTLMHDLARSLGASEETPRAPRRRRPDRPA